MKAFSVALLLLLVCGCTQTAQQPDPTVALSQNQSQPTFTITKTAIGHANLQLSVEGSARYLMIQRSCVLGRFATENGSTHILMPEKPKISLASVDGRSLRQLDHPFEYFVTGQNIPDGAKTRNTLLSECKV